MIEGHHEKACFCFVVICENVARVPEACIFVCKGCSVFLEFSPVAGEEGKEVFEGRAWFPVESEDLTHYLMEGVCFRIANLSSRCFQILEASSIFGMVSNTFALML